MIGKGGLGGFAAILLAIGGSACAMSRADKGQIRCTVEGGEKLPAEVAGPDAVCAAIERAVLPVLERSGMAASNISVAVTVKSDNRIAAVASAGERTMPEQNVGITDRKLNGRAVEMLAQAIAVQLGELSR